MISKPPNRYLFIIDHDLRQLIPFHDYRSNALPAVRYNLHGCLAALLFSDCYPPPRSKGALNHPSAIRFASTQTFLSVVRETHSTEAMNEAPKLGANLRGPWIRSQARELWIRSQARGMREQWRGEYYFDPKHAAQPYFIERPLTKGIFRILKQVSRDN